MADSGAGVLRSVLWSFVQLWGQKAIGFLVMIILARLLSPVDFGIAAIGATLLAHLSGVMLTVFGDVLIQRKRIDEAALDTAFWMVVAAGLIICVVLAVVAGPIAAAYDEPAAGPIIRGYGVVLFVFSLGTVQQIWLTRQLKFKQLAIRATLAATIGGIFALILASQGVGAWSLVSQQAAAITGSTVVLWILSSWRPRVRFVMAKARDQLSFGKYMLGIGMVGFIERYADILVIGFVLGTTALGLYSLAQRLVVMITELLVYALGQVALPVLSRLQSDPQRFSNAYLKVVQFCATVLLPVFAGLALIGDDMLVTVAGEKWRPAGPILSALCVHGLFYALIFYNLQAFNALNRPAWTFRASLLFAATALIAVLAAAPFGAVAVAWAVAVRTALSLPVVLIALHRLVPFGWGAYGRTVLPPVCATLVMMVTVLICQDALSDANTLLRLVIEIAAGAGSYAFVLWFVFPSARRDAWEAYTLLRTRPSMEAGSNTVI